MLRVLSAAELGDDEGHGLQLPSPCRGLCGGYNDLSGVLPLGLESSLELRVAASLGWALVLLHDSHVDRLWLRAI